MDTDKEAHLSTCVCDYHVYNAIWSVAIKEELQCAREVGNAKDIRFRCHGALTSKDFLNEHKRQLEYQATYFNHVTNITQI